MRLASDQADGTVIVAVAVMGVVEVAVDEEVGVAGVRHGRMATLGGVGVTALMTLASMVRRARCRVLGSALQRALVDVIGVHAMQVAIVEIVRVVAVTDRGVSAAGAMRMIVRCMSSVAGHLLSPLSSSRPMQRRGPSGKV